jgi:excisionase family DNA binding protein
MSEQTVQEWLTLRQVQEILGIGSTKAYSLVATGEIPSVRIGNRAIRVSRQELERWLESQRRFPSSVHGSS